MDAVQFCFISLITIHFCSSDFLLICLFPGHKSGTIPGNGSEQYSEGEGTGRCLYRMS